MDDARGRKIAWFSAGVFILLLACAYMYFVQPMNGDRAAAERFLDAKQRELALLEEKAAQAQGAPDADRIALERVSRRVPEQPEVERLIRDLRRLEVVSRTRLLQYDISADGEEAPVPAEGEEAAGTRPGAKVLPVRIQTGFTGTYGQFRAWFAELEALDRLIQVERLSMQLNQGPFVQINADQTQIVGSLSLKAYYAPELQALLGPPNGLDYENSGNGVDPVHL